jgi:YD repeat-containing protein
MNAMAGYARTTAKYDDRGYAIEWRYFGADGKPLSDTGIGVARLTAKFDDRGNETEWDYFDPAGRLVLSRMQDAAKIRCKYNLRGEVVEQDFFGVDGRPRLNHSGWARAIWNYDGYGNVIMSRMFDAAGHVIQPPAQTVYPGQ